MSTEITANEGQSIEDLAAGAGADEFNLKTEDKRRQRLLAYGHVFGSREGKMVLADMMQVAGWHMGVESSIFYDNASHAQMAFREGQKEVVRHILRLVNNNKKEGV